MRTAGSAVLHGGWFAPPPLDQPSYVARKSEHKAPPATHKFGDLGDLCGNSGRLGCARVELHCRMDGAGEITRRWSYLRGSGDWLVWW